MYNLTSVWEIYLQLAKIKLVHLKTKILLVLSNSLFFPCCDINIEYFSIALVQYQVIVFNLPCFIFGLRFSCSILYCSIYSYRSSDYCDSNGCCPFSLLRRLIEKTRHKISYESIYETNNKKSAKRLRAITFTIAKMENQQLDQ